MRAHIFGLAFLGVVSALGCGDDGAPGRGPTQVVSERPSETTPAIPAPGGVEETPAPPTAPSPPVSSAPDCTAGPLPVHPSLPKLTQLFSCKSPKRIVDVARTASHVYVAGASGEVLRVAPSGGSAELVTFDPTPGVTIARMVASAATVAYVVVRGDRTPTEHELRVIPAGQSVPILVQGFGPSAVVAGIAQGPSEIYVSILTDFSARTGKVIAIDAATFQTRTLAEGLADPRNVATDGTHVFVESWGVGVVRVPLAGGAPDTVLSAPGTRLGGLAVDGSSVFALDLGTFPEEEDGKLLKAPKAGGSPTAFGLVFRARSRPLLDGNDVVVSAGAQPKLGDPGLQLRPMRYAQDGSVTELVSPMLAYCAATAIASDASALYFASGGAVLRLER